MHVVPYKPISVGGNVIELESRTINGVSLSMRIDLQRDDFLLSCPPVYRLRCHKGPESGP